MQPAILGGFQAVRAAEICRAAGARFLGIQKAMPERGLKALSLFADQHGSSLAVRMGDASVEAVRRALAESERR